MPSIEAPRPPPDSELSRELTYAQKQLLASGRTQEVVRVIRRRSRRRLLLGIVMVSWIAHLALTAFASDGPFRDDLWWVRVLFGVVFGACTCLSLVLTVHTYRKEQDYVEMLQRHHPDANAP